MLRLLLFVHGGVQAARLKQLGMCAFLQQFSFVQDEDAVGATQRGQAVTDHDGAGRFLSLNRERRPCLLPGGGLGQPDRGGMGRY